jgi:hypothetical protein
MKKTVTIVGCVFIVEQACIHDGTFGYVLRDAITHERGFIDAETLNDSQH